MSEFRGYSGFDSVRMPMNHLSQDAGSIVLIPVINDWSVFNAPERCRWTVLGGYDFGVVRVGPADTVAQELIDAAEHKQTYVLGKVTPTGHLTPLTDDGTLPESIRETAQEVIQALGW